ncbi:MAG: hypothetical protein KDI88_07445 [Gammaproteobacteria bacterium]|nr:hypothetical protein [Gammaproteobacteria bacterium]
MDKWLKRLLEWLGQPQRVEFDYRDRTGPHHGCVYVSCLFANDQRVRQLLDRCGYTNIQIG